MTRKRNGWSICRSGAWNIVFYALFLLVVSPAFPSAVTQEVVSGGAGEQNSVATSTDGVSDAERVARHQELLMTDEERLRELQARQELRARALDLISERFHELDRQRRAVHEGADAEDIGGVVESEARAVASARSPVEQQWHEVRDYFDAVIRQRKAVAELLQILPKKIDLEKQALDYLTGTTPLPVFEAADDTTPIVEDENQQLQNTGHLVSEAIGLPVRDSTTEAQAEPIAALTSVGRPYDDRVVDAEKALERKQAELLAAEARLRFVDEIVAIFKNDLTQTKELLQATRALLSRGDGIDDVELLELSQASAGDVSRYSVLVENLEVQVGRLDAVRTDAIELLREAGTVVDSARAELAFSKSAWAPHHVAKWFVDRGPKIILILIVVIGAWALTSILAQRVATGMVRRGRHGTKQDREERADTLLRVSRSMFGVIFAIVGSVAVLQQFGIDLTVLVGGAAIVGMALAFGAQNLVRDYFSGVMMLMENQYRVGNIIRIGGVAGKVEDVTLRMTVIRDLEGTAHFIPHSQIQTVSNLTHGWARVVLNIGVAYKEDVDRVMELLMSIAEGVRQDPELGRFIVGEPQMLGVDAFADSAVIVRFVVKTQPQRQWVVRRELLRRIKNEFNRQGIEIPFPHRTIYHRGLGSSAGADVEGVRQLDSATASDESWKRRGLDEEEIGAR